MNKSLPTIEEMFHGALQSLDDIYRKLGDTRDLLNSDWSDGRVLTPAEANRRADMLEYIGDARLIIELAKK